MDESENKGFFAKLFGGSKSCCCNVRIEEVPEEELQKEDAQRPPSCCGDANAAPDDAEKTSSDKGKEI